VPDDARDLKGQAQEQALRAKLGFPADAQHVLIFAESSHWDPDWLLTWDEYFDRHVRRNLDAALDELTRDPRRVYSLECLFFLQKYWEASPDRRGMIQSLINSGRLRLTSTGVTTADTLITSTEAILRDWLMGQEWLRANGMSPEPTIAYFPDSFGCSHSLPSLLNAAGFTQTAITRLDGMLFTGCDWPFRWHRQWESSSAAVLMKKERTLDFVWRDSGGGEVLCHWNAFTYGQGDMLAYTGLVRMYLYPWAISNRSDWNVTRRIQGYARQLLPLSRTPYLFCPIGFDFVGPIPDLVPLLDRYNQKHYPRTGIWAVNAGLEDYLALVDCHRDQLPVLELDPNPYWTGFYSARPSLKKLTHAMVVSLLLAEALAVLPENEGERPTVKQELEAAWGDAVVSNHHDFVTGTSPDRVAETEQIPWLQRTAERAERLVARLGRDEGIRPVQETRPELPEWSQHGGFLEIRTQHYSLEMAEGLGGCISRAWVPASGQVLLGGPSNDLVAYEDSGGLWRMGHEFIGGRFRELGCSSLKPARLEVRPLDGCLEVCCTGNLEGEEFTRRLWFRGDSPVIRCQACGRAADKRTVTVRFNTGVETQVITMDEPGGVCVRPVQKKYVPTFWPVQSFAHIRGRDGSGLAVFLGMPGAVAYRAGGTLELVTHRNAVHETAFGMITFPGQPATGHDGSLHVADYAILLTPTGDWLANNLLRQASSALGYHPEQTTTRARLDDLMAWLVEIEPSDVVVAAIKPATRGDGIIVRLLAPGRRGKPVVLRCLRHAVTEAWLCDARERDLERLEMRCEGVHLSMPGSIATVRVVGATTLSASLRRGP